MRNYWNIAAALALAAALSACAGAPQTAAPADRAAVWTAVDPVAAGWNAAALADVMAYAKAQKSTGFLIIQHGRVVAESYWPVPADATQFAASFVYGVTPVGATLEDVASQQKSFIAVLAGVAVDKGLLDLSKPASAYLGPGWSKAPAEAERAITVLNLLNMNSGLNEQFGFEAPAGTKFFYNTPVYAMLKPVLEKASGKSLDELTRAWMTEPLGMGETAWRKRPQSVAGASGNATGLVTTPRDTAKLGRLVLDGGLAPSGARVLSKGQLEAMLRPSATNPGYGRLWWLNGSPYWFNAGPNARRFEGPMIPSAPADLVAAQGAQDRKLYVSRSRDLIVVRMGQATPDGQRFNEELWRRLAAAMPK